MRFSSFFIVVSFLSKKLSPILPFLFSQVDSIPFYFTVYFLCVSSFLLYIILSLLSLTNMTNYGGSVTEVSNDNKECEMNEEERIQNEMNTCLLDSVQNGKVYKAIHMIGEGADVNVKGSGSLSSTPLHIACNNNYLKIVEILLDTGADVNATRYDGKTPLHVACSRNDCELNMVKLLVTRGADIHATDIDKCTPIYYAADCWGTEVLSFLLQVGADPNVKNSKRYTPLHKAVESNLVQNTIELLDNKANIEARNDVGKTPLHLACGKDEPTWLQFLYYTLFFKPTTEVALALIQRGAEVNVKDNQSNTPLHLACGRYGSTKVAMSLVDKGADLNTLNNCYKKPIDCFVDARRESLFRKKIGTRNELIASAQEPSPVIEPSAPPLVHRTMFEHTSDNSVVVRATPVATLISTTNNIDKNSKNAESVQVTS